MRAVGRPQEIEELRHRLRAWVAHESESGRRALLESWAQTIPERVDAGECVAGLRLVAGNGNGSLVFACPEDFTGKFREGEPLFLGSGVDVETGWPVTFLGYDVESRRVRVAPDRFESREPIRAEAGVDYCLDRRGLGVERMLLEGLDSVFHPENAHCIEALLGRIAAVADPGRHAEGAALGRARGFTANQCEALGRMVATEGLCLIQGPPGTGKTRLLAEAALHLARKGCRLFVTGFTHRAVNNVLLAVRALSPEVPIFKVGRSEHNEGLAGSRIATLRTLESLAASKGGLIVGGTPFAARRFTPQRHFHFVLMDEAGQMPVVHGAIAMTQARRWVIVGDPRQLSPVRQGDGRDLVLGTSLYEYLEGSAGGWMLDHTFRMNEPLTRFVSDEFYGGRLRAAEEVADARLDLRPGGPLRDLLDAEKPLVLAQVDHEGRSRKSPEEARLVVDIVEALRRHHEVPASEIAVIAPFRAQVRSLRYELERRGLFEPVLVVDTVERMQGQERDVVILSLVASDRDYLEGQTSFFHDPGRLNVSLTRARTKCIVVASRHAFRPRPPELEDLLNAARFKRLALNVPTVDLTSQYVGRGRPDNETNRGGG